MGCDTLRVSTNVVRFSNYWNLFQTFHLKYFIGIISLTTHKGMIGPSGCF